jgi:hypothetical protein
MKLLAPFQFSNNVEAFLNLLVQRLRVQTLAEEDRLDRFAQLGERGFGRA